MSRSVQYRRTMSDAVCWHQREALNATIYILREVGPTGFLLKEEGDSKNFKVYLGDPHTCTCSVFKKERDLCKHLCWLLLKKFRIPETNPLSWQLGFNEREINETLRGLAAKQQNRRQQQSKKLTVLEKAADGKTIVQQREIDKEDVCPICQEELLSKFLPVTYCKFSCGNSIHMKCMKVWAQHQKSTNQNEEIRCPVCREDFGPLDLLRAEMQNAKQGEAVAEPMDVHNGKMCRNCTLHPIQGHCYRCTRCANLYLCHQCFNMRIHLEHDFEYRHMRNHRWRPAQRPSGRALPEAIASDMMNRDLSEADYELLLQLDHRQNGAVPSITEEVLRTFPTFRVTDTSSLLAPGSQCRICLRGFEVGQTFRKLPICKHKFHKSCIDGWLLHSRAECPIDGTVVWDPNASPAPNARKNKLPKLEKGGKKSRPRARGASEASGDSNNNLLNLEVPGVKVVLQPAARGEASRRGSLQRGRLRQLAPLHRAAPHADLLGSGAPHMELVGSSAPHMELMGSGVRINREEDADERAMEHVAMEMQSLPGMQLLNQAQERHFFMSNRLAHMESLATSCIEEEDEDLAESDHGTDRMDNRSEVYTADATFEPFVRQGSFGSSNSAPARINRTRNLGEMLDAVDAAARVNQPRNHGEMLDAVAAPAHAIRTNNFGRLRGRGRGLARRGVSAQSQHQSQLRQPLREVPAMQSLPSIHSVEARDVQDLYLGYNPRDVPPVPGGTSRAALRSKHKRDRAGLPPRSHHPPRRQRQPSLVLEGNALENLTLRDILN